MHIRSLSILAVAGGLLVAGTSSSCRKTIQVGNKPNLEFTSGTDLISSDMVVKKDTRYTIQAKATKAEDQTPNVYFEITRTYVGGTDTSVFDDRLEGNEQNEYYHSHTFNTRKFAGTERFVFTVKNNYGITNQKVITLTVQ